uniref:Putative nuclease HARBI1 n=1 Tax=Schizaphis graminum TaxID=13262 RepID=A0A2S2NE40_SCHGA
MIDDDLDMLMHFNNLQLQIDQNIFVNNKRRYMVQEDPFIELSDRLFIGTYRLCKKSTQELICTLTPYMIEPTTTARLSIKRKVLTALRFFASGSYQQDIGEHRGAAVSQSSVSRCITEVAVALNNPMLFNKYVQFPTTIEDLNKVRLGFYEKYGIPGVIGVQYSHSNSST